ncbi:MULTISPECIES: hypothetical protein [unclassified Wolbachia]|uniref:hypothetical protein n=1 Tax=unclassified Wolbachia TaxID=2640676 RepID=UPI002230C036|nr:hypothetical protein [Wolbachia endosymbiont (group A) of Apoderus coryli]
MQSVQPVSFSLKDVVETFKEEPLKWLTKIDYSLDSVDKILEKPNESLHEI